MENVKEIMKRNPEKEKEFLDWLQSRNVFVSPKLDLFHLFTNEEIIDDSPTFLKSKNVNKKAIRYRGVKALQEIDKDEVIIRVPSSGFIAPLRLDKGDSQVIDVDKVPTNKMHPVTEFLLDQSPPLSNFVASALRLMHEMSVSRNAQNVKSRDLNSSWIPFMKIMPNKFSTLMWFSDDEKKELKGTSLEQLTDEGIMQKQFESLVLPILKKKPELWSDDVANLESFKVASSIVMSRGFHDSYGNGPYILPCVDMLNHSTEFKNISLSKEDDEFVVKAEMYIMKGSEVFNCYGELSNAQLLQTYGFVESENPHDHVTVPVELVLQQFKDDMKTDDNKTNNNNNANKDSSVSSKSEETEADLITDYEEKVSALRSAGVLPDDYFIISKEDMLPGALFTTIQVIMMNDEEFDEWKTNPIELGGEFVEEDDGGEYIIEVYQHIVNIIDDRLKMYPKTFKDDFVALTSASSNLSENMKNILSVRSSEQRMLLDLKAQLREEVKEIKGTARKKRIGDQIDRPRKKEIKF